MQPIGNHRLLSSLLTEETKKPTPVPEVKEPAPVVEPAPVTEPPATHTQVFQYNFPVEPLGEKIDRETKASHIREAMVNAFAHYQRYAWGRDELKPVSHSAHEWLHLGITIVDSLDTLYIMGLHDLYNQSVKWIRDNLKFDHPTTVSVFETNIRVVGGLLSAYQLSGDKILLDKAVECGKKLLPAFDTPSGISSVTM